MNYLSVGDMAQTYSLRRHDAQLKTVMARLTDEVMTGVRQDRAEAVGGNLAPLASIEHRMILLGAYDSSAGAVALRIEAQQASLGLIEDSASQMGTTLLSLSGTTDPALVRAALTEAAQQFELVLATLNTQVGGQHIFAGAAVDTAPVASSDDILAALQTEISGLTGASDIAARVSDWFGRAAGAGGFLDLARFASDHDAGPYTIAEGEQVTAGPSIMNPVLRQSLTGFAIAALIGRDLVPADDVLRADLAERAGESLLVAETDLIGMRGDLGVAQKRVATAQVRNASEKSALELARSDLIGADPYESATALEAVQGQMDVLYALTARLSAMSLVDYL